MLDLSTLKGTDAEAGGRSDFDPFAEEFVQAVAGLPDEKILTLADRLHDVLRARRGPAQALRRYAVIRCGEEWRIVSGRGRIGHFDDWNDAFAFCEKLARETVAAGHRVELLVQSESGELLPL